MSTKDRSTEEEKSKPTSDEIHANVSRTLETLSVFDEPNLSHVEKISSVNSLMESGEATDEIEEFKNYLESGYSGDIEIVDLKREYNIKMPTGIKQIFVNWSAGHTEY